MQEDSKHTEIDNNNYYTLKVDKKFLDRLSEFIQSVESQMDIMLPRIETL